jgi:hypothetical protein
VGTSKGTGKQWQTTPKNLPRMQRVRAIPVACLGSIYCQNRLKGHIYKSINQYWITVKKDRARRFETAIINYKSTGLYKDGGPDIDRNRYRLV